MSKFKAPSIDEIQDKFSNHDVKSFIAKGGMGAVYLATQISLDREVAIKILPQEFGDDENYKISFETEAKAMAKLNHSNLVGIYDFGSVDGMLFIIMEYIPGRSLFDTAHGQAVDQIEAATLIAEMCHGLHHAHEAGMLHRDIKPVNVLIDDEARPKIVDFGLAKPLGENQPQGIVFGTPGYTAPEVVSNPYAVDQRSDIFSVGVMLHELLTAELPKPEYVTASELSGSDVRFDNIIAKAIHPNPLDRYRSAGEMAKELEDLIKISEQSSNSSTQVGALVLNGGLVNGRLGLPSARPIPVKMKPASKVGPVIGILAAVVMISFLVVNLGGKDNSDQPVALEVKLREKREKEKQEIEEKEKRLFKAAEKRREEKEKMLLAKKLETERLIAQREREEREQRIAIRQNRLANKQRIRDAEREEANMQTITTVSIEVKPEEKAYGHQKFIDDKRSEISVRASSALKEYNDAVEEILRKEEKNIKRAVRRTTKSEDLSDLLEIQVEDFFKQWKAGERKIYFSRRASSRVIRELNEFIAQIAKEDDNLKKALLRYQQIYERELVAMARKLKNAKMSKSFEALKAELDSLNQDGYFHAIVLSEKPNPENYVKPEKTEPEIILMEITRSPVRSSIFSKLW